jgi:hypothetical protein
MFGYRSTDYSGRYFGVCVCGNCRRRFAEMYGKDLPLKGAGVVNRPYGKGHAIFLPWLPDWLYQRDSIPDFRHLLVRLAAARRR